MSNKRLTFCCGFLLSLIVMFIHNPSLAQTLETSSFYEIHSIAWSPDGTKIALGRGSNECSERDLSSFAIEILDTGNQEIVSRLLGHHCYVSSLSWNGDGQYIASASADGSLRIWDVSTGVSLSVVEPESFYGRLDTRWRPDGNTIASIAQSGASRVQIIDRVSGTMVQRFAEQASSLSWSPNGSQLAVGQYDNVVTVWDADNGNLLGVLNGHTAGILTVAWSPDGTLIASGGADNTVRIWSVQTGELIHTLLGHPGYVSVLDWHPDSHRLVAASYDGTIRVWNVLNGQVLDEVSVPAAEWINAIAWSPDGNQIAFGGGNSTTHLAEIEIADWIEGNLFTPTSTHTAESRQY